MESLTQKTSDKGIKGRGAAENPGNRFEALRVEADEEAETDGKVPTRFFRDHSKSIIAYNDSPDIGFGASFNPYRGCEHGCVYCYARPTHEYLGFSAGLDFETKIMVKEDAPALLRKEFSSPRWQPQVLAVSGVTDCYQPIEKKLRITRGCLEVCADFLNPVAVITKNHLVTRDIDVLKRLAEHSAVVVFLSVTTLDAGLARIMEPRTSTPEHRLDAVRTLSAAGIRTGVMVAPVIPALNDSEIPAILKAAAEAGAEQAGFTMLRLPHAVKTLFAEWLERHFPERKNKVLHRLEEIRGGKLNDPNFGSRMRGHGVFAEEIEKLFRLAARKAGLNQKKYDLSAESFRRPGGSQMKLF